MPIIKDKYRAKEAGIRSKYVTRKVLRSDVRAVEDPFPSALSTSQKQEELTRAIRSANINKTSQPYQTSGITTSDTGITTSQAAIQLPAKISGIKLIGSVQNILTLNKGESLKDIIISYSADSSAASGTISLYWSPTSISDLEFTTGTGGSAGRIMSVTGGTIYSLFTEVFTVNSTLSLNSNNMFDSFTNMNKTIYFYACSNIEDYPAEITTVKC